jgi:hypothetical protein
MATSRQRLGDNIGPQLAGSPYALRLVGKRNRKLRTLSKIVAGIEGSAGGWTRFPEVAVEP